MRRHIGIFTAAVVLVAVVFYRVGANTSDTAHAVAMTGEHRLVIDDSGRVFTYPTDGFSWRFVTQCPPGTPVSLVQDSPGSQSYWVLMVNGDVYVNQAILTPNSQWIFQGNAISGAVRSAGPSWGEVKRRY
jgi:hypothetical protein